MDSPEPEPEKKSKAGRKCKPKRGTEKCKTIDPKLPKHRRQRKRVGRNWEKHKARGGQSGDSESQDDAGPHLIITIIIIVIIIVIIIIIIIFIFIFIIGIIIK